MRPKTSPLRHPQRPTKRNRARPLALTPEQQAGLWKAKLGVLARDHLGRSDGVELSTPWGAVLDDQGTWTVLLAAGPERSFGQALVLAASKGAHTVDMFVDGDDAGSVARRAVLFDPSPTVWRVDEREASLAAPTALVTADVPALAPHIAELVGLDDLRVVAEHGALTIECRGLEVGRIHGVGHEQRLEVGVGVYDQGAFAVMNPGLAPAESLAEVVAQVLTHRRSEALPHPLNRLVRERWLRWQLLDDPSRIGLVSLEPVEPVEVRTGLYDVVAATAIGVDANGASVLVACSVGIDLDAAPAAADLAALHGADRIVLVMPERDQHRLIREVAARSRRPMSIVTADQPWP